MWQMVGAIATILDPKFSKKNSSIPHMFSTKQAAVTILLSLVSFEDTQLRACILELFLNTLISEHDTGNKYKGNRK